MWGGAREKRKKETQTPFSHRLFIGLLDHWLGCSVIHRHAVRLNTLVVFLHMKMHVVNQSVAAGSRTLASMAVRPGDVREINKRGGGVDLEAFPRFSGCRPDSEQIDFSPYT